MTDSPELRVQPVILAAGKGKRMGNPDLPKVLSPLLGQPVVRYLLKNVAETGFMTPVLVVGFHHELVRQELGSSYKYVVQPELLGTGHALACCEPVLAGQAHIFLVMNGDQPLLSATTMQRLVKKHQETGAVLSMATVTSEGHPTFTSFGRIVRDEKGEIAAIREYRDASAEEREIKEVNPALYCFSNDWLWSALPKIGSENSQNEYYLTDLLEIAVAEGQPISSVPMEHWQEALGINTPEDLSEVEKYIS